MTIPASQVTVVKGLTTITGHHKSVHVFVKLSPKCVSVLILGNTSELKPGTSEVEVVILNRSGKDMKLRPPTEIVTIITANIVPTTEVSNKFDGVDQRRVCCMSVHVGSPDTLRETLNGNDDSKIFYKSSICLE